MEFSTCGYSASVQISESLMCDVLKSAYDAGKIPKVLPLNISEGDILEKYEPEINLGCPKLKLMGGNVNSLNAKYSIPLTIILHDIPDTDRRMSFTCIMTVEIIKKKDNNLIFFVIQFREPAKSEFELDGVTFSGIKLDDDLLRLQELIIEALNKNLGEIHFNLPVSPIIDPSGFDSDFYATEDYLFLGEKHSYLSVFLHGDEIRPTWTWPTVPQHPQQLWETVSETHTINCAASVTKKLFFKYIDEILINAGLVVNRPLPGCENLNRKVASLLLFSIYLKKLILKEPPVFQFHNGYISLRMKIEAELENWWNQTLGVYVELKLRFDRNNKLYFDIVTQNIERVGRASWYDTLIRIIAGILTVGISEIIIYILKRLIKSELNDMDTISIPSLPLAETFLVEALNIYISTDPHSSTKENIATLLIIGKGVDIFSEGFIVRTNVSLEL